jgi:hypothetical protein
VDATGAVSALGLADERAALFTVFPTNEERHEGRGNG